MSEREKLTQADDNFCEALQKHIENGDYDKQCKDVQVFEIFAHREEQGDIKC